MPHILSFFCNFPISGKYTNPLYVQYLIRVSAFSNEDASRMRDFS
jgi:hypothetical protein